MAIISLKEWVIKEQSKKAHRAGVTCTLSHHYGGPGPQGIGDLVERGRWRRAKKESHAV